MNKPCGIVCNVAQNKNIAVLGAGSFGTALANVLADNGHWVTVWGRDTAVIDDINRRHQNSKYLKELPLNPALRATTEIEMAVQNCSVAICALPTQKIRTILGPAKKLLAQKLIINASKGIEIGSALTVSGILNQIVPEASYAILSGPSFAQEVARRYPTAVTAASSSPEASTLVQSLFSNGYFRVYTGKDVIGVELAGALKNVIAIGAGVVSGLKLGYNAQAAIINRGVAEMARLARLKKADPMTFLGLAGMGDLVLTCTGPLSRNRTAGVLLGEGVALRDIESRLGGVAEGVYTAKSAYSLARNLKVEMPITEQVYKILYEGQTCQSALEELMARDPKMEWS